MKRGKKCLKSLMALLFLISASAGCLTAGSADQLQNPFRVLVIIGDQWKDPSSYLIDKPGTTGEYSGYEATPEVAGDQDFHHLVMLLKSWGIPFDIVRLDQQLLDRYMFLDMHSKPKYGTIIWDVNDTGDLLKQDYSIVTGVVREYGIGLIALSDRISQPEIQDILGIKYTGGWESNTTLNVKLKHFITQGLGSPFMADSGIAAHLKRQQVVADEGTVTLVEQGTMPQVTIKDYPSGCHVVWIGNDHNSQFYFSNMRTILRRAITWTIGYNLYKTWENEIIMIMDDPGGASGNWLEHWHYPELSEEIIEKYLIKPLLQHHAVLNINFVPAFVDDNKRRLDPTWDQNFTDSFGTRQNYISAKKGYDKGISSGVFTVMSHGLTHMQPDLVSDPGWYGSALGKERSEVGWYREFGDTRRNREIPPAEQLWRMKTSAVWLKEQFGVEPLEFCPGGLGTSVSYFCNTARLAGEAGYGWYGWEGGYLGRDMVINGWKFFGSADSPLIVGAPPDFHDFGISRSPEKFASIFEKYPAGHFISINEFIGYLHSRNSGGWDKDKNSLTLSLEYDPHYCQHFDSSSSSWHMEFSDWFIKEMGKVTSVRIDGKAAEIKADMITVPDGTGTHHIELSFR